MNNNTLTIGFWRTLAIGLGISTITLALMTTYMANRDLDQLQRCNEHWQENIDAICENKKNNIISGENIPVYTEPTQDEEFPFLVLPSPS